MFEGAALEWLALGIEYLADSHSLNSMRHLILVAKLLDRRTLEAVDLIISVIELTYRFCS